MKPRFAFSSVCSLGAVQRGKRERLPVLRRAGGGNIEIEFVDGFRVAHIVKPEPDVSRHVSHFATCPNAATHRR